MDTFTKRVAILLFSSTLALFAQEGLDSKDIDKDSITELRSGGFIGAGLGMAYTDAHPNTSYSYTSSSHLAINLKGGYQHFSNPYLGFRVYGDLNYGGYGYDNDYYTHSYSAFTSVSTKAKTSLLCLVQT